MQRQIKRQRSKVHESMVTSGSEIDPPVRHVTSLAREFACVAATVMLYRPIHLSGPVTSEPKDRRLVAALLAFVMLHLARRLVDGLDPVHAFAETGLLAVVLTVVSLSKRLDELFVVLAALVAGDAVATVLNALGVTRFFGEWIQTAVLGWVFTDIVVALSRMILERVSDKGPTA